MRTLNLGILAHVDAGKTTLTERLLHAAGVIDELGSVDDGSTQTDSLALERQRGITIRSAVVSFTIGDVAVNLIDTPGHPDFIAEVERVLCVLDGAVLVVSAVEGVQAQTRVLYRTLRRLRIPTLLFVNKIDRRGARYDGTLAAIGAKLTPAVVPMGRVRDLGTRTADLTPFEPDDPEFNGRLTEVLAEHDDALLAAYAGGPPVPYRDLRAALAAQAGRALVHPVFFGSAATGAGVDSLTAGIAGLLPAAEGDRDGPLAGTVFKIEGGTAGEKITYVRLFTGTVRIRDRLPGLGKVTGLAVFDGGLAERRDVLHAGQIGVLRGLDGARVGDPVGAAAPVAGLQFAPPTLETVVVPRRPADKGRLHTALTRLAEQDPLINLRQDDARQELSVSLYGEVQKEVIEATLAADHGLAVDFRPSTTICVERPVGIGTAAEAIGAPDNPFLATVGLRVEPAPVGTGVRFRLAVELGSMPLAFFTAIEETVTATLREGLHGWQVTDCLVTVVRNGFAPPVTAAADFRLLTPMVLMDALTRAGTTVCEPVHRFRLEAPPDTIGSLLPALARAGAVPGGPVVDGVLSGVVPASTVAGLQARLPGLTRGEGLLEYEFDHYAPVRGRAVPDRPRTDHNPLCRKEYLLHVVRRVPG